MSNWVRRFIRWASAEEITPRPRGDNILDLRDAMYHRAYAAGLRAGLEDAITICGGISAYYEPAGEGWEAAKRCEVAMANCLELHRKAPWA